jgi:melibiose permease
MMMSNKTKWIFGASGIGKDAMFAMSTIMMIYLVDYVGINAAFVGIMFMAVRVWDAINDPVMGTIVDNTKSRWGKFRPWILIGTVLNAVVLVFVFYKPDLAVDSTAMLIYITIFYTLWGMTYTLMDIPFWSMIPALTEKQSERESISAITRFFTSIGYFIVSAPYIVIVIALGGGESNSEMIHGFFLFAIIISILFLVSQVIMVMNVKEEIIIENEDKITLKKMFLILKENDQLMVVMVVIIISNFVLYITGAMAYYYIKYDIGNLDLLFPFLAFGGVVQISAVVLYPMIAKKMSRKKIYNLSITIQVVAFIFLFLNAFFLGNIVVMVFIIGVAVFFGQGLSMVLQTVLISDTVEYGELVTGRRSEAIVFSVQTFVVKLATGLSMGVVGVGLWAIKFVPDIDDLAVPQSNTTIWGIRVLMFILPVFGMLLSRYIFNKKHIIDEKKYESIVEELKIKRGGLSEKSKA